MQPKTFMVPVHRTGLFLSKKKKKKEKNTQKIWSPSIWTRWFGIRHGNPLLFTFILIAPLTLFIDEKEEEILDILSDKMRS